MKRIKDINIRLKIIKLLEENTDVILYDLGFDNSFLDMIQKHCITSGEGGDKLDFIKIKSFCMSKNTIKEVKRQPTG